MGQAEVRCGALTRATPVTREDEQRFIEATLLFLSSEYASTPDRG